MISENSKPVSKSDDAAKDFLRLSLGDDFTRGFDVDSVYCEVQENQVRWTLIELLKCDTVAPEDSHPRRYWKGKTSNRRKFLSLWALCLSLREDGVESRLLLVNYRDEKSMVKLMEVDDATEESIRTREKIMTFDDWKGWFRKFNANKAGSTWDVLQRVAGRAHKS